MDLKHSGRCPVVLDPPDGLIEVSEISRIDFAGRRREGAHDLAEDMPQRQDSIAPETLGAMIIATGVMVVIVGCSLLLSQGAQLGFAFACGVAFSLFADKVLR